MERYDFDQVISRKGTGSVRWDGVEAKYGEPDLIPLTTADMDFPVARPIREALKQTAEFGILGYTGATPSYYDAVERRFAEKWGWEIRREWIEHSPGIVGAVAYCIQGMTAPGDGVVLPVPMYHPFAHLIEDNGRTILHVPLIQEEDGCRLDFEALERQLSRPEAKMLIFCNPHNPIGRAWRYEELRQVCELCLKHGVVLVSDEIHCDFVFRGHTFCSMARPMAELEGLEHFVLCSSASKSFNIAGLQASNIIIPGAALRERFQTVLKKQHMMEMNMMGPVATEAAYRYCDDWQAQVLDYLEKNRDFAADFLGRVPGLRPVVPEATYMMWIDCRGLGLSPAELDDFFAHRAKVGLNPGPTFGPGGEGYVRLNFATPRPILEEALRRIEAAASQL